MKIYALLSEICGSVVVEHSFKAKPTVEDLIAVGIDRDDAIEIEVNDHPCYSLEVVTLHDNIKREIKKNDNELLIQGGRCLSSDD